MVTDTIFLFEYCSISDMSSEDVVASMVLEFGEDLKKKKKAKTLSNQHTSESIIFSIQLSEAEKKKNQLADGGIMYSNGECELFF